MALADWPRDGRTRLLAATLAIGLGVGVAVAGLRAAGWLQGVELAAYDRFVAWRAADGPPSQRVALVQIRERDIATHGHPLPDALLARALARIGAAGPRAIGVDLYRAPPGVGQPREGWDALAEAFRGDPRLVVIEKLPQADEVGVPAPPFVAGTDQVGFSDVVVDADGVVRRGLLILWDEHDSPSLSFSLQLALRHLGAEGLTLDADPAHPEYVRLGDVTLPFLEPRDGAYVGADTGGYQYLLDFRAGRGGLPVHDLSELLAGRVPDAALRDRVVLLGTSSPSVKDDFVAAHSAGERVYGAELHGHAVDQLLRIAHDGARPMGSWSEAAEWAWIAGWALLGALLVFALPNPLALGAAVAAALAALGFSAWSAFRADTWLPLVPPALAALASTGLVLAEYRRRERAERRALMDLFGRFVSRPVADELWRHRDEFLDGGRPRPQRLVITAMLTDLKGYTKAAEAMDPATLMGWVNEYMDAMTRVVMAHGGLVDDYTGDGIKANFGAPLPGADPERVGRDARAAVACALEMGRELERLALGWRARGLPIVPMRVGLCTGEAVGGNLGSADRMKYTTVGDVVNTAARLESFHKDAVDRPGPDGRSSLFRILVAESTRRHLDEGLEIEELGEHELRGREGVVRIHRLWGERKPRPD